MISYSFKRIPLSLEDEMKLRNSALDYREKLIIIGLLETGMRLSEFANLTRDNFRWQENKIIIKGKGDKQRFIPLTPKSRELFESWFTMNDKIPWSCRTIQRIIAKVAERAGVKRKIYPHILRHTFCVRCLERGIDCRIVQRIVGHSSIITTMQYLNIADEGVMKVFQEKWR